MAKNDPKSRDDKLPKKQPELEDEPTILIDSSLLEEAADEPGYMVRPRDPDATNTDEIPGMTEEMPLVSDEMPLVTEEIPLVTGEMPMATEEMPIDEVEDVVVLLDDDGPVTDSMPEVAEDVGVLLASPGSGGSDDITAEITMDELPDLENVEDITSLIADGDSMELTAPDAAVEFDIHTDPEPVAQGRSSSWFLATAAAALIAAGAYFATEKLGWAPWERFTAGDDTVAENNVPAVSKDPAGTEGPEAAAVKQQDQFRRWIEMAHAAHLGPPTNTPR